ncbi:hypothetical protein IC007_0440 [Sulfuracidifex tepidarius]|uniref:Uncharacterized protein n=1 Tax=Sulfuracidifex tepidarius TaxID=1294262 RepID=A0A510E0B5_9CREN|nr:hypothetical protein IC007_0440 [Sulfuracidifex tepidarius]
MIRYYYILLNVFLPLEEEVYLTSITSSALIISRKELSIVASLLLVNVFIERY